MKISRDTWLRLATLVCFIVGYQLLAHGVSLKDSVSLGFGYLAFLAAFLFLVSAVWIGRKRK